jgi:hypothetical protein
MPLLSPSCHACGRPVPFAKTQWGLGEPFSCVGCETQLVIPKNFWIGSTALVFFWIFKNRMKSHLEIFVLIAGLALVVLIMSRFFLIPEKV